MVLFIADRNCLRDYGSHSYLLTSDPLQLYSIPSGMTGKQRPAVPLGFDLSIEQRSSDSSESRTACLAAQKDTF